MKDETARKPVQELVDLLSKMYSLKYEVMDENDHGETLKYFKDKKTAKGVSHVVIDKQLKHDTYRDCLFQQTSLNHEMNFVRSHCHQLYSITVTKTSMTNDMFRKTDSTPWLMDIIKYQNCKISLCIDIYMYIYIYCKLYCMYKLINN